MSTKRQLQAALEELDALAAAVDATARTVREAMKAVDRDADAPYTEAAIEFAVTSMLGMPVGASVRDAEGDVWTRRSGYLWMLDRNNVLRAAEVIVRDYGPVTPVDENGEDA